MDGQAGWFLYTSTPPNFFCGGIINRPFWAGLWRIRSGVRNSCSRSLLGFSVQQSLCVSWSPNYKRNFNQNYMCQASGDIDKFINIIGSILFLHEEYIFLFNDTLECSTNTYDTCGSFDSEVQLPLKRNHQTDTHTQTPDEVIPIRRSAKHKRHNKWMAYFRSLL